MDTRRLRQLVKDHGVPRMLRYLGVAPAASSRFLLGQQLTLMRSASVDCVLDVGANVGQYARELRAAGYTAAIHSFEPGPDAYRLLSEAAAGDPRWTTIPLGLARKR